MMMVTVIDVDYDDEDDDEDVVLTVALFSKSLSCGHPKQATTKTP